MVWFVAIWWFGAALAGDVVYPIVRHADLADGRPEAMAEGFAEAYETEDGSTIRVGGTLVLGQANGMSARSNVVGGGAAANLGLGIAHGTTVASEYFTHIFNGTYAATVGKMVLAGLTLPDPAQYMAPARISGVSIRVARLKLGGTRNKPVVWAECTFVNEKDRANASGTITVDDLDAALRLGEVVDPDHVTRQQAIDRLKEAKDLLDLGVYSAEQYEAEKARYVPFIVATEATSAAPAPLASESPSAPAPLAGRLTIRVRDPGPYSGVTVTCPAGERASATLSDGTAVVVGLPEGGRCTAWLTGDRKPVSTPVTEGADLTCTADAKLTCSVTP